MWPLSFQNGRMTVQIFRRSLSFLVVVAKKPLNPLTLTFGVGISHKPLPDVKTQR